MMCICSRDELLNGLTANLHTFEYAFMLIMVNVFLGTGNIPIKKLPQIAQTLRFLILLGEPGFAFLIQTAQIQGMISYS